MTTYEIKLYECYIKKCNNEFKKRKNIKDVWFAMTNKITNDYINGIIKTRNEYIKIMDKLDSDYLNSIENINMHKCEIANCYKSVKQYLDYLHEKNNYKKKNKYSIQDYINIIKINKNLNLI
jgi:hypothetical protein